MNIEVEAIEIKNKGDYRFFFMNKWVNPGETLYLEKPLKIGITTINKINLEAEDE